MNAYIPTKEDLEQIVSRATRETVTDVLPEAIYKATRKKWLTTKEVAEMLQVSIRHMQHLRDSGQIEYHQNSRTIRFHIDAVEKYLNNGKVKEVQK